MSISYDKIGEEEESMAKYGKKAQEKVEKAMHEMKEGKPVHF